MVENSQKTSFLIPKRELDFEFFRSPGPGGQNVNKVSSSVRVRWDIEGSKIFKEEEKEKIRKKYPNKITGSGDFIVESRESRSQLKNRIFALERLQNLIRLALKYRKDRKKRKIPKYKKEERLQEKKKISEKKKFRKINKEDFL